MSKKLVSSDYKYKRVEDPTKISDRQAQKVKKYCKEFFDKAVVKHRAYEEKRAKRNASLQPSEGQSAGTPATTNSEKKDGDGDHAMSFEGVSEDIERATSSPMPNGGTEPSSDMESMKKRKRDSEEGHDGNGGGGDAEDDNGASTKKHRPSPREDNPPPSPPRQGFASSTPAAEDTTASISRNGDGANDAPVVKAFTVEFDCEQNRGDFGALPDEYMIDKMDDKGLRRHDEPMHGTN